MSESHERFELLLFGANGGVLYTAGKFDFERQALLNVNDALRECPLARSWKIIRSVKTVAAEGDGPVHVHREETAPANPGRWW
jgi:hypothetical protein